MFNWTYFWSWFDGVDAFILFLISDVGFLLDFKMHPNRCFLKACDIYSYSVLLEIIRETRVSLNHEDQD